MSVLIIGPEEQKTIDEAIAKARSKPIPLEVLKAHGVFSSKKHLELKNVTDEARASRQKHLAQQVQLGTYCCAISFEHQPLGLYRHISVSCKKGELPNPIALDMILEAFGFHDFCVRDSWIEEFEPGWNAINVIKAAETP